MKVTKRSDGRYQTSVQFNNRRKFFIGSSKKEVEKKAVEYVSLHNKGIEITDATFSDLIKKWFDVKQKKNAEKTKIEVSRIIRNYIEPALGDYPVKSIKSMHVQNMLNSMMDKGLTSTVEKTLKYTKSIFEFGVENDYCYKNVAKSCLIKKYESKERKILSEKEIETLENSDNKYKDFFQFMLYTGLRRGEIAGLRWSDIDLKSKEIHVNNSMSFVTNKGCLKSTKTGKVRNIPILDKTAEILKSRKHKTNSIYVFSKQDGSNLSETAIKRMYESFSRDTGLTFGLHELRHTFCTILYYAGVSPLQASKIMGHSLNVMQGIYTHLDKNRSKEEIEKLNEFLSK